MIDMDTVVVPEEIYLELVDDKKLLDFIIYYYMDQPTFDDTMVAYVKYTKEKGKDDDAEE